VTMADGSRRPISHVKVGDLIQGRWQINTVLGLQQPKLQRRAFACVNRAVFTTTDHMAWTEHGFQAIDKVAYVKGDRQTWIDIIIDDNGTTERLFDPGIEPHRVNTLAVGSRIAKIDGGFETVETIDIYTQFPEELQLYSLRLSGDHTMAIDGYVFSGWANDQDFDYDARVGT
jgi:hypothetical protein